MKDKIYIIGGSGLEGSALALKLAELEHTHELININSVDEIDENIDFNLRGHNFADEVLKIVPQELLKLKLSIDEKPRKSDSQPWSKENKRRIKR